MRRSCKYRKTIFIAIACFLFLGIFPERVQAASGNNSRFWQSFLCSVKSWWSDQCLRAETGQQLSTDTRAFGEIEKQALEFIKGAGNITIIQDIQGQNGEQGERGQSGNAGTNGETGSTGATGSQGEQGIQGERGPEGSQGPAGTNGTDGEDGKDGEDGADGQNGRDGQDASSIFGSSIDSSEITDSTITFSDWASNSCTDEQIPKYNSTSGDWECGNDSGGTSYISGGGLSLSGSTFSLDLDNANSWTGLQTFSSGLSVGGNTYTNLAGTGLSFSGGTLSSSLGTTIESAEIANGTIANADLADATLTFAKIAQNSCGDNQIIKWNGSAWACAADNNDTYTAGTGLALSSGAFALDISGLSAVSAVASSDTVAVYTGSGLKKITRSDLFSDVLGSMNYRGTWNATTNSPALASSVGTKGYYYVVSTSGTTTLDGISTWAVNDWVVFNGSAWERVQTTNSVSSVFGRTGSVTASGGDYTAAQITNAPDGNIVAVTVQNALSELDGEKLATTLNSGLLFVGNASNVATGVAMSGDATMDNAGVITIGADKVALGTDTTGNYVATLADSGAGIFTIANSGNENAAVTLALVDDVLDFTKLADALTLDAATSMTLGGNDLTMAITGGGLPKFTRTSAGQWLNFADGTDTFGVYNIAGTPEASIAANKGSLAIDTTNGDLYIKTTDTLNTGWSVFGLASSGITSLNGLSGQTQTFAVGTSGTDFAISSSGTTHTFSLPDASATARGLITTGAQTIAGAKTFSSALTLSGSSANIILGSNYLSGDGGDEGIYVNSSGKVGIGTASPAYPLAVSGGVLSSWGNIAAQISNNDSETGLQLINTATGGKGYALFSTSNLSALGGGKFVIADWTSQAARLTINSSGYVGIGTVSPSTSLHIANGSSGGTSQSNASLVIESDSAKAGIQFLAPSPTTTNSRNYLFFGNSSNNYAGAIAYYHYDPTVGVQHMSFRTNGVYRMDLSENYFNVVNSSSNSVLYADLANNKVGISTATPDNKLHVYSGDSGGTSRSSAPMTIEDDTSAYLQLLTPNTAASGILFGDPELDNVGYISYNHANDSLKFVTNNATALTLDSSGNAGIGDTTPDALLDLYSAGGSGLILDGAAGSSNTIYFQEAGNNYFAIQHDGSGTSPNNTLNFMTASGTSGLNTTALTIKQSGNIGIGTTSPGSPLTISGTGGTGSGPATLSVNATTDGGYVWGSSVLASSLSAGNNVVSFVGTDLSSKNAAYLGFHNTGAGLSSNYLKLGLFAADDLMVIRGDGNIGIGDTTPDALLDLSSAGNTNMIIDSGTGSDGNITFQKNGADQFAIKYYGAFDYPNHSLRFMGDTDGSGDGATNNLMTLTEDGLLGIGDATPDAELDVVGSILYTGEITDVSDATLKENIVSLDGSLEKLLKLKAISFTMIGDENHQTELGFTAQDVKKYFPELVSVIEHEDGTLGLNYMGLIAPTIQAIQELASLTGDQRISIEANMDGIMALDLRTQNIVDAQDNKTVFKGRVVADTIQANNFEGLDFVTGAQLSDTDAQLLSQGQTLNDISEQLALLQAKITGTELSLKLEDLQVSGGATFKRAVEFQGPALFKKLAEFIDKAVFKSDVEFAGNVTVDKSMMFNSDTAGYAVIRSGDDAVSVEFEEEYANAPIVTVTPNNFMETQYKVKNVTKKGFEIIIKEKEDSDLMFSWTAVAVKEAKTTQSGDGDSSSKESVQEEASSEEESGAARYPEQSEETGEIILEESVQPDREDI